MSKNRHEILEGNNILRFKTDRVALHQLIKEINDSPVSYKLCMINSDDYEFVFNTTERLLWVLIDDLCVAIAESDIKRLKRDTIK